MHNRDITMSDAPADGGDDDSHSNTQDKPRGSDIERNVKRTKNDGEVNNENEAAKAPPNANTKSVAMHMCASGGRILLFYQRPKFHQGMMMNLWFRIMYVLLVNNCLPLSVRL
jgi:hypothetical protein